jgi:hypothetical protein
MRTETSSMDGLYKQGVRSDGDAGSGVAVEHDANEHITTLWEHVLVCRALGRRSWIINTIWTYITKAGRGLEYTRRMLGDRRQVIK